MVRVISSVHSLTEVHLVETFVGSIGTAELQLEDTFVGVLSVLSEEIIIHVTVVREIVVQFHIVITEATTGRFQLVSFLLGSNDVSLCYVKVLSQRT